VYVIEPDDGSGWVKVATNAQGSGKTGLVPASYIDVLDDEDDHASSPSGETPGNGGKQGNSIVLFSHVD
jgi:hypothetical protein